jgi:hypothetical protein
MLEREILAAAAAVAEVQETLAGPPGGFPRSVAGVSEDAKEHPEVQEHPQAVPETPEMRVHQALHRPRLVLLFPAEAGAAVAPQAVQAPEAMAVVAYRPRVVPYVVFPPALAEVMGLVPVGGVVQGEVREGQAVAAVARAL